jgi:hypothetical protein
MANLFFTLALIDYYSDNIPFAVLENIHNDIFGADNICYFSKHYTQSAKSRMFNWLLLIYNLSPNAEVIDCFLTKWLKGCIYIGDVTIHGYDEKMWAVTWIYQNRYWLFRPPHVQLIGENKGFNWGILAVY